MRASGFAFRFRAKFLKRCRPGAVKTQARKTTVAQSFY
jgi:hypothetical protein